MNANLEVALYPHFTCTLQDGAEGKHKDDGLPDWVMVRYHLPKTLCMEYYDCLCHLVAFSRLTTRRELKERKKK